ncbi:hypothetical protein Smic_23750 [Streptomyces microflavus]|uniref:Uncharacterized protein n=1 Tax=Streptomyces microflavus TaxID=1919 RepID=A0A7J0CN15_STRMI|nr:hypothetical protein Smic_23750 [Streptomyces microflavus]
MARVKWHLAASGRGEELAGLLHYERENPGAFSVKGLRRARIELPGIESSSLPSSVRNFNRSELPVRGKLLDLVWEDGKLVVKGYAYIPNVPSATGKRSLRVAVLRRQGSRSALPLRLRTVEEPRATTEAKGALHNYDWSGFEIGIDPGRLRVRGQWQSGTWRLGVGIPRPGGMSVGSITKNNAGAAGHSYTRVLDDGVRLVAGFDRNRLKLTVDVVPAEIESQESDGDTLTITLRSRVTAPRASSPPRCASTTSRAASPPTCRSSRPAPAATAGSATPRSCPSPTSPPTVSPPASPVSTARSSSSPTAPPAAPPTARSCGPTSTRCPTGASWPSSPTAPGTSPRSCGPSSPSSTASAGAPTASWSSPAPTPARPSR